MDNVTHSLIGVAISRAIPIPNSLNTGLNAATRAKLRDALTWSAVLGSNLPDFDFLAHLNVGGLEYILHHRGYTHTFLFALPLAAIAAATGVLATRLKKPRKFVPLLFGVGLLGVLGHIFADSWNDYGVHPFSPFYNRWFFGDAIYILEPTLWLALLPLAILTARRRWSRYFWIGMAALLLGAVWFGHLRTWPIALALTLWGVLVFVAQRKYQGAIPAYMAAVAVLVVFSSRAQLARSQLESYFASAAPEETLLQLVTTPAPGNPFCWRVTSASKDQNGNYIARRGVKSVAPTLFPPDRCFRPGDLTGIAPLAPVVLPQEPSLSWGGEFRSSIDELRKKGAGNCRFDALMRFARAPFWVKYGDAWVGGDLRYDDGKGDSFAKIAFDGKCPESVPWQPPLWNPFLF